MVQIYSISIGGYKGTEQLCWRQRKRSVFFNCQSQEQEFYWEYCTYHFNNITEICEYLLKWPLL